VYRAKLFGEGYELREAVRVYPGTLAQAKTKEKRKLDNEEQKEKKKGRLIMIQLSF
jgi:hypothetical protein